VGTPRELVDAAQVGTALAVLSVMALLAALGLGFQVRRRRSAALVRAALIAGAVALVYPMWVVYNSIEDHFGLDSVAALLINLALFMAAGAAVGLALRRY
jgi:Kef-type K+ transport system membrane component KefB